MPDLLLVFSKRWKLILTVTILATVVAAIVALLSPKKYLAIATALPANSMTADKARVFNQNIEALYSEFGTPDELDRMEGTGTLDTIFIVAANELNLANYYSVDAGGEAFYKAAMELKKNARISRSSYGELKVKVWDKDRNQAATMANLLMNTIQQLHQQLIAQINNSAIEALKKELEVKQQLYSNLSNPFNDTAVSPAHLRPIKLTSLTEQILYYEKLIGQYQMAARTNPPLLLIVENARPPLWPDKPKPLQTVAFVFFGALLFSFLMALFLESRKHLA